MIQMDKYLKKTKEKDEDPIPLTDEEFAKYQKKENRKANIFVTIIDFFLSFFH